MRGRSGMLNHLDHTQKNSDVDVFRISADLAAEQAAGEDKFSMNIVLRRYDAAHDAADAT